VRANLTRIWNLKRSLLPLALVLMLVPQVLIAASCPTKSTEQWLEWFEEKAKLMSRNVDTYEKEVIEYAKDCGPTWNLKGLSTCSQRLVVSAQARAKRADAARKGSMGWEMSDKEYGDRMAKEFKTLPPELKDGLPKNYREIAKQKGWKVLQYRSRTVPNPPNRSFARVLIVVEGEKDDKYIQFTVSDDPSNPDKPEQLIDYLSVEHNKNNSGKNPQIHFAQFWRDQNGKNPRNKLDISSSNSHGHMTHDSCYSCHPNGVRELSPEPGSYSKEDADTYAYLKKKMGGYGKIEFNGALTPEAYGAPMGKEQGCTKCHNNFEGTHLQSRGALNYRTEKSHIAHKMNADFSMPVTSLDPEKELQKTIDQIPYLLSDAELKKFQAGIRGIGQEEKNEWAIDKLKELGKIDAAKHKQLKFVLNGHPNYPNCLGELDCFIGIKKTYEKMNGDLRNTSQYADNNVEYYMEKCTPEYLIPNANPTAVEDGSRSNEGGFFNSIMNFFGVGEGSKGSQQ
jgi:hypothetical protein